MVRADLHLLRKQFPLAGQTVRVFPAIGTEFEKLQQGAEFLVEDWYENVYGTSWSDLRTNWACKHYHQRVFNSNIPVDDDVLYGKIGCLDYLVHVSEIEGVPETVSESVSVSKPVVEFPPPVGDWPDVKLSFMVLNSGETIVYLPEEEAA